MTDDAYERAVRDKARRMAKARKDRSSVWRALGQAGTVGWQVALPTVGCTLLGQAIGKATHSQIPTLIGIGLGVLLGIYGAARAVRSSMEDTE